MLDDALHADKLTTRYAEVTHEFLCVLRAEVGLLHELLLFICDVKSQVVFGKLLRFEGFVLARAANGTEGQSLLFNFDETHFAKSVTTVQVARYTFAAIEVLVARGTLRTFHYY